MYRDDRKKKCQEQKKINKDLKKLMLGRQQ